MMVTNQLGKGIFYTVRDDGHVELEFDGKADFGPSSSGKTTIVATTSGNKKIVVGDRELFVGINVYVK